MTHLKRTLPITIAILLMIVLAACGGSTSTGSNTPAPVATTPAPVATTPAPVATTPAPVATTPGTSNALIKTATATVQGKSVTILTDAAGKTLYYFTPDSATTSACTGSCAQAWPPLLMSGSGTPTSATTLSGTLTVATTGNGSQVEYNGHLLYAFSGDSGPGMTNGEGLLGKWFVATTDLK